MELELYSLLRGRRLSLWEAFVRKAGLEPDSQPECTAILWDGESIAAAGSRQGNLLKYIAVEDAHQGEGLLATVVTALRQDAFQAGYDHLFLYTKPQNEYLFASLFFYPIARTDRVLLMESRKDGIRSFLSSLPAAEPEGTVGAAVMNCNPFTLGHRYLIESAAKECRRLYLFVLSEDKSEFSAHDRMEMVKRGTADLPNVTVLPTGPYLISSATFPTYFLKEREQVPAIQCGLDVDIFRRYYAPRFGITRRFVGTEPLSPATDQYNRALKAALPAAGIQVIELPRFTMNGLPVSASAVRRLLAEGQTEAAKALLPQSTIDYLNL